MVTDRIADYQRPPLVETVLGVQFNSLQQLTVGHLGAFWGQLGDEWPLVMEAPPIVPQFERFGSSVFSPELGIRLMSRPEIRLRILNASNDRMIQTQQNRFIYNWIKKSEEKYPEYPTIRDGFSDTFDKFQHFLTARNIGSVRPNQWEVTYINAIPKGTVWEIPGDWKFFSLLNSRSVSCIEPLESFGGEWHFPLRNQIGRLHIKWAHQSDQDGSQSIGLTLTARGPLNDLDSLLPSFDLGRSFIVQTFRELMSESANSYWGLIHGNS